MTDLTERLRALKTLDVHWERLATEAADEIERLEQRLELALGASRNPEDVAEIERLQKLYDVAVADRVRMHEEIKNLQAENKEHIDAYQNVFWENERLREGKR